MAPAPILALIQEIEAGVDALRIDAARHGHGVEPLNDTTGRPMPVYRKTPPPSRSKDAEATGVLALSREEERVLHDLLALSQAKDAAPQPIDDTTRRPKRKSRTTTPPPTNRRESAPEMGAAATADKSALVFDWDNSESVAHESRRNALRNTLVADIPDETSTAQDGTSGAARLNRFEPLNDTTMKVFRKTPPPSPSIRHQPAPEIDEASSDIEEIEATHDDDICGSSTDVEDDICGSQTTHEDDICGSSARLNRFEALNLFARKSPGKPPTQELGGGVDVERRNRSLSLSPTLTRPHSLALTHSLTLSLSLNHPHSD